MDQDLPANLHVRTDYVLHVLERAPPGHQVELDLSWTPHRFPLGITAAARQRPLTELPRPAQDMGILFGIGAGGLPVSQLADGFQTREVEVSGGSLPWERLFLFAAGSAGWLSDGNADRTFLANVSLMAARVGGFQLWVRYGLWYADYDWISVDYWTPIDFLVQQPTLETRYDVGERLRASATLGVPVDPGTHLGLHTEAKVEWHVTDAVDVRAGFMASGAIGYRITAFTVGVGGGF
jgi:hypothetical protein